MLSGVKFIARDKIDETKKVDQNVEKHKKKGKVKSSGSESESDDEYERKKKKSGRRKKWYSSEDESDKSEGDERKHRKTKTSKRIKMKSKAEYSSSSESDMSHRIGGTSSKMDVDVVRKEMGLEWMLKPQESLSRSPVAPLDTQREETPEEMNKVNPRELNPYLKDNGTGYPEDNDRRKSDRGEFPSSSVVGDGGASWRLKALKRAQEQAAREGRRLEEVAEERWGSLGQLAVSVSARKAAPSRSHLHAIRNRKSGLTKEDQVDSNNQNERDPRKSSARDYLKDVSSRHSEMREPKARDSLSWGKKKGQNVSSKDEGFISMAVSSLNKFSNDGNFARQFLTQQSENNDSDPIKTELHLELILSKSERPNEDHVTAKEPISANQLAAKAFQLQIKGKHEEAQKLLQEVQNMKETNSVEGNPIKRQNDRSAARKFFPDMSRRNKEEEDADLHLAQKIMQNKQYSMSGRADDEYDYEDGPRRKSQRKRGSNDDNLSGKSIGPKRIITQEERCTFCFENPNRPRHLSVSIANYTYLMLPQWQPVVTGHCCILPIQHESATRSVEKNVWEEIRNFKKCLIMMFAKQEKEMVFLETVVGLAKQRRHCLIECIPLPQEIAKEAPLYFKKAIDEVEEEWSQHNAKKLIDTSEKGLRGSIPEHFPYFHVEFGLNKGFVHVIDDEKNFKTSFGLNVIRGMMRLAEEDMHRRRRYESIEVQKQAVANFLQDWEPFDWTKQL